MDAAQGTLTVGRAPGPTGQVDGDGLALAMPARDPADCGEVVRAPIHHEHAGVVPRVHVEGVLTRTEAGHRGVALAKTDPARGRARRLTEEPDLLVRRGAVRHHRLVISRAGRKGELLAPDGDRLGLRVVRVHEERARARPGGPPRDGRRKHLLVAAPGSRAPTRRNARRYRDRHREDHACPPGHTAVFPPDAALYASGNAARRS